MPKLLYASTKNSDMLYAVKVEVPDPFFYIDTGDKKYVFLDHREFGVFEEKNKNEDIELVLLNPLLREAAELKGDESSVLKLALFLLQKYDLTNATIEVPTSLPLDMADYLRRKGVELSVQQSIFPQRLIKSPKESDAIRDALGRTHNAFRKIEEILEVSKIEGDTILYNGKVLTSEIIRAEVEQVLLAQYMLNVEGMIISCGQHAAIPHHPGSGIIRPYQTIICDIFPRHRATGYFADMTRTYVKGEPSEEIQKLYEAVDLAQTRAENALKPSVRLGDIHQICVDTFLDLGYHHGDKGFIHGTGHGLGLDIHEEPYVRGGSETIAETGHVVTIEPGLYYPELGGVRIEDVVLVTENGCKNLTQYSKDRWIIK